MPALLWYVHRRVGWTEIEDWLAALDLGRGDR